MNTTLSPAASLASIRDRFTAITQEQERLEAERRRVLVEERNRWRADGKDAHIVSQPARGRKIELKHLVSMFEVLTDKGDKWVRDVTYTKIYEGEEPRNEWGPYLSPSGTVIWLHRGVYVCTLADDEAAVIVCAAKFYSATVDQVARAASRLRGLARREHMRASIHDTTAALKSPMNDVVHEGDINSAYLWLCGINEAAVEDRTKAYWECTEMKERAA